MRLPTITFVLVISIMLFGCVEEYYPENLGSNTDVLVIDARITNEFKRHEIRITRSGTIDMKAPIIERGAHVIIKGSEGNYDFIDAGNGTYLSELEFSAIPTQKYQLEITLASGKKYLSKTVTSPGTAELEEVYIERTFNEKNEEGLAIYVNGSGLNQSSSLYRYEYQETFKIVAPNWVPNDFLMTNYDPCALPVPTYDLELIPEPYPQKICYGRNDSKRIILNTTLGLDEDVVQNFEVLFIQRDNYYISHRYSILVKQYVDTPDAYSFFELLKEVSIQDNSLSAIQPGFVNGNIVSTSNQEEKIAGFFSVSTVSEKRIFFDFEDFFPGEKKPPYVDPCALRSPPDNHPSYCLIGLVINPCPASIPELINWKEIEYVGLMANIPVPAVCPGEYVIVNKACGDCTVLGSNVKPDFWEDN